MMASGPVPEAEKRVQIMMCPLSYCWDDVLTFVNGVVFVPYIVRSAVSLFLNNSAFCFNSSKDFISPPAALQISNVLFGKVKDEDASGDFHRGV